jgi:hypothetical protein
MPFRGLQQEEEQLEMHTLLSPIGRLIVFRPTSTKEVVHGFPSDPEARKQVHNATQ